MIDKRQRAKQLIEKIVKKKTVSLLAMAMKKMQSELAQTTKLASLQLARTKNPSQILYITLLWLQDPTCLHFLRSFDQELQTLPSVC